MNVAFIMPYEVDVLKTIENAAHINLGSFILIGDKKKIIENCFKENIDFKSFIIYDYPNELEAIDFGNNIIRAGRCDYIAFKGIPSSYFSRIMDLKGEMQIGTIEVIDLPLLHHYLFLSNYSQRLTTDFEEKKQAIIQAEALIKALNIKKINAAIIGNLHGKTDLLEMNIIRMLLKDDKCNNIDILDSYTLANLFSHDYPNNIYNAHINLLIMRNYEATRIFIDSLRIFSEAKIASIIVGGHRYAIDLNVAKNSNDVLFSLLILNKITNSKKCSHYKKQPFT